LACPPRRRRPHSSGLIWGGSRRLQAVLHCLTSRRIMLRRRLFTATSYIFSAYIVAARGSRLRQHPPIPVTDIAHHIGPQVTCVVPTDTSPRPRPHGRASGYILVSTTTSSLTLQHPRLHATPSFFLAASPVFKLHPLIRYVWPSLMVLF
jgi:hypothetical protein